MRLDAHVRERFGASWGKARGWITTGKVFVDGAPVLDPGAPVPPETRVELRPNAPRPRPATGAGAAPGAPARLPAACVLHVDTQVIVVDKPAGVSTVPFEPGESGTLEQLVAARLGQRRVFVVQRLDRETTGPLVFARTADAARSLADQFRRHTVTRRYWALALGAVAAGTIRTTLVEDRGDGRRGSARPGRALPPAAGREAVTHVEPVARLGDVTLVECRLETGRTHQIRIHLAERGHPLLGERVYGPGAPVGGAPRLMLHAWELAFTHPTRGDRRRFACLPPPDFLALLDEPTRALLARRVAG